jgi:hypothetical protein
MSRGDARHPSRRQRFAARGREQRELDRRREAGGTVDVEATTSLLLERLTEAKVAALQLRMVMVAAEISQLIRGLERPAS